MFLVFEKSTKNKDRYSILDSDGQISGSVYVNKGVALPNRLDLEVIPAGHPEQRGLLASISNQRQG